MPQAIIGTLTPGPVREYGAAFAFSLAAEETGPDDPTSRSSQLVLAAILQHRAKNRFGQAEEAASTRRETVARLTRRPAPLSGRVRAPPSSAPSAPSGRRTVRLSAADTECDEQAGIRVQVVDRQRVGFSGILGA